MSDPGDEAQIDVSIADTMMASMITVLEAQSLLIKEAGYQRKARSTHTTLLGLILGVLLGPYVGALMSGFMNAFIR